MSSTYLTKTSPTAGNRTKGTISVWIKRSGLGANQWIYTDYYSSDNYAGIRFGSNDTLGVYSVGGGSAQMNVNTNKVFRDTSAWYHLCVAWDTTDGTAADRIKVYVNGERETFSGSPTYPTSSQEIMFGIGGSYPIVIGRDGTNNSEYFNGSMSHFHRVDNQALAPTVFGSTDSTTGEWKISTSPSITYTGSSDYNFFILKDGNSVTDQSGQSNNLTVGAGTLTKTEDSPSNVFATVNSLQAWYPTSTTPVLSNGNNTIRTGLGSSSSAGYFYYPSTLGMPSSGKWYFEVKPTETTANCLIGIVGKQPTTNAKLQEQADGYMYSKNGNKRNNNVQSSYGDTYDTNDIIGVAVDLDNNKIYFSKNGTYQNSGVPTSGSTGTGAAYTIGTSTTGDYFAVVGDTDYAEQSTFQFNFGNGYFGTTAVSSAGTNASGNGIFEYDVPTGYTALSTKGLNL